MKILSAFAMLTAGLFCNAFAADPSPSTVTHIDHEKVTFDKGGKVLETSEFKIMTSHREEPGKVEIHEHDTDIFHVIDGTAEFVTGGTVVRLIRVGITTEVWEAAKTDDPTRYVVKVIK